ncbi:hypothetical protein RN001_006403 [Aquatica leii]|uniref:Uncharacterized protein n=1 Tax=Aquatica leii TaxID=1421715 RepID=A0AAN7Q1P8_9COLE|nr:hypothetical protein RN001_006403 [Aquatica leii]
MLKRFFELRENILYFNSVRNESVFENFISIAKEISESNECSTEFPQIYSIRPRKIKRQFDYEHSDETVTDPKQKFKVNFYYVIMYTVLNFIDERFDLMRNHNDVFGFLNRLKTITKEKHCDDLTLKLTDNKRNHCDVDGVQLFEETISLPKQHIGIKNV